MEKVQKIGKYTIVERIGRGGMGYVYRAVDPILKRDVALKTMLKDVADDADLRSRFLREAQSAGGLRHPNIVTIYDLGEDENGLPYIAMEFLTGTDMEHIIKNRIELQLSKKLEIIIQTCSGLGFAHTRGIVHRDIKPANIRLLDNGEVKIMDFGIAKITSSQFTRTGMIMGTPHYMAPEQIRGEGVDGRADIFSLGVVLYELLAFRKPFPGENPTSVLFKIIHSEAEPLTDSAFTPPPGLEEVVARALAKKPEERYQTCDEFNSDLIDIYTNLPKNTEPTSASRTPLPFSGFPFQRTPTSTKRTSAVSDSAPTRHTPPPSMPPEPQAPESRPTVPKAPTARPSDTPIQPPTAATVRKPETFAARDVPHAPSDFTPVAPTTVPSAIRKWLLIGASGLLSIVLIVVLVALVYKRFSGSPAPPAPSREAQNVPTAEKPQPEIAVPQQPQIKTEPPASAINQAKGWLSLNVLPWAEVSEVKNDKGDLLTPENAITPCRIELPAGRYTITLRNAQFKALTLQIDIKDNETTSVFRRFDGFDSGKAADSIQF